MIINTVRHALLNLLLLAAASVAAGDELNQAVDAVFVPYGKPGSPGCAAGVIHNGEYIHKAGYGLANLEYNIPITPRSVFRTGSVSKQFTAMAIAILAERGDLDLDADIHDYLPDLMDYGHKVTLRQMLHHISGMGDYEHGEFRKPDGSEIRFGNEDYLTVDEFYDLVKHADLLFSPATRYEYSNLGYFLLGQVVERVSGKTLRQFAHAEIFGPLGMERSFFNDNVNQPVPNRVDGYKLMEDGSYEIYMTNLDFVGDGGVYTNLDDFIAWDRNFYDNRLGQGGDELIRLVTTPHPDAITDGGKVGNGNYAFGLRVGTAHGELVIGHTGTWVGFSAFYHRYPDLRLSIVVFCNSTREHARELGDRVAAVVVAAIKDSD